MSPNVFQLLTLRPPIRANLSDSEGSPAGAMWVSGMSEASAANPDEGAEQCEATEELQLDVRRWIDFPFFILSAPDARRARSGEISSSLLSEFL